MSDSLSNLKDTMSYLLISGLILAIGGLIGVLIMAVRKMPTLAKLLLEPKPKLPSESLGEKVKTRLQGIKYSGFLPQMMSSLEKGLRRFRLLILKTDNFFVALIKRARNKSDTWNIRSRAWMEHRRLKKKEKTQLLENLDKVEISQTLERTKEEVAKDEDKAFQEKVEIVNCVEEAEVVEPVVGEPVIKPDEEEILTVSEDEKKQIDAIVQNPKDTEAYRALCDIYFHQQNYSDARACFRQLLKLAPGDADAKAKLESIKGLRGAKKK